jgi:hypothetical protein
VIVTFAHEANEVLKRTKKNLKVKKQGDVDEAF